LQCVSFIIATAYLTAYKVQAKNCTYCALPFIRATGVFEEPRHPNIKIPCPRTICIIV
jgi:hypothetical protein